MVNRSEKLLRPVEVAKKIGVSKATFYRIRAKLIARGVKTVVVGSSTKYLESSVDSLILKSANSEKPLC